MHKRARTTEKHLSDGYIVMYSRTIGGGSSRGKSSNRALKKAVARLDYVVGAEVSNAVVMMHGSPLLNRTPTTAREIKESYVAVQEAKRLARVKAFDEAAK